MKSVLPTHINRIYRGTQWSVLAV